MQFRMVIKILKPDKVEGSDGTVQYTYDRFKQVFPALRHLGYRVTNGSASVARRKETPTCRPSFERLESFCERLFGSDLSTTKQREVALAETWAKFTLIDLVNDPERWDQLVTHGAYKNTAYLETCDDRFLQTFQAMDPRDLLELTRDVELHDLSAIHALANEYQKIGADVPANDHWAFYWHLEAARRGHVESQLKLADMYYEGLAPTDSASSTYDDSSSEESDSDASSSPSDHEEAEPQDNSEAQHGGGKDMEKNYTQAYFWYREAAEQGSAAAQFYVGHMYYHGHGVEEDDAQAAAWFRLAAEQDDMDAHLFMGHLYRDGQGVEVNYVKAVQYLRKVAEHGHPYAQYDLALMYYTGRGVDVDYAEAVAWYRKSAEQGYPLAQTNLGCMYDHGHGVEQSDSEALAWYQRAAEQGDEVGQNNVAWMYDLGQGVEQSDQLAWEWYLKAAQKGYMYSQCSLGSMLELGQGVERDDDEAFDWYSKAAEQGEPDAIVHVRLMESEERRALVSDAGMVVWHRRAAENGDPAAQFNLGLMYEKGLLGVPKDIQQAHHWYGKARAQNHENAKQRHTFLDRYNIPLSPDSTNEAQIE
ncbi:hypothetical protein BGW41_002787 [Actinomortierella wolfii]|nr:hypothetical protein BGW41_002787 [Actinomortierella wolfii]